MTLLHCKLTSHLLSMDRSVLTPSLHEQMHKLRKLSVLLFADLRQHPGRSRHSTPAGPAARRVQGGQISPPGWLQPAHPSRPASRAGIPCLTPEGFCLLSMQQGCCPWGSNSNRPCLHVAIADLCHLVCVHLLQMRQAGMQEIGRDLCLKRYARLHSLKDYLPFSSLRRISIVTAQETWY